MPASFRSRAAAVSWSVFNAAADIGGGPALFLEDPFGSKPVMSHSGPRRDPVATGNLPLFQFQEL
ncbi:hypothetical protein RvVAR0630_pl07500 (plasmid) [Agrobacterium vitis]|nr:hypothetical protein RvVAR0630_pl07500 [Agrobacterium vitis]